MEKNNLCSAKAKKLISFYIHKLDGIESLIVFVIGIILEVTLYYNF